MKFLRYFFTAIVLSILSLQLFFFIQILAWRWVNPSVTSFQLAERHRICGWSIPYIHDCGIKREWMEFKKISPYLKRTITISEDSDFYRHMGFEPQAMKDAWNRNQKNTKHLRGGSTITQQLAKNLFLSGEKNYIRKAQEFVITAMLEITLPKERIFEIYLNHVEWGEGVFGVSAAAQHYFSVKPHQLSIEEAASLAAALPAPKCYDKVKYCSRARVNFPARIDFILERMNK
ncbi:monofunctional biosynthetic peptidoglycan transglycosylase [Polynucleobacter sp. 30F-ANTBAC]|uniref:monofunctional biosynthetic peptidoglycan transglycosylase n=1 Tax=Polynucleobacter sp. 30F-ANTBAC TaxID=2689095 RepID=UPI001C0B0FF3|nr:monofunctional biosynthetic peptidoglycan transglycosylase [Polynucleobacter sp. 30F-ANTBAC]MBU3599710.1 monofunctional biosynthetic peptidoglycan transglycosylase [Polynucleobacter sp. 30F-ANTBAC]